MSEILYSTTRQRMRRFAQISLRKTHSDIARILAKEPPTRMQLRNHFFTEMVPMIGFGIMDQTVMIQAGNAIDCTLGVTFGLSTLAAAACGQIFANSSSVVFGGTVEQIARKAGLPCPSFSAAQRSLPIVRRVGLFGNVCGVVIGCVFGLVNLLFIDTSQSSTLKIQALDAEQEFAYEVEASNLPRHDATTLKVRGPDVDGLLASITAALTASGCSLVEMHAKSPIKVAPKPDGHKIEDVFIVVQRGRKKQIENDDLDELARTVLAAIKDPFSAYTLKKKVKDLDAINSSLIERINKLEKELENRQINIVRG